MKTAGHVMTPTVHQISASATVAEASTRMEILQTHSLIVERESTTDAFGIVTSTDIIQKVIALGKNPSETRVYEVMTKPIITIPAECTLFEMARLMARHHINHLPVFDGHQLVGMVSSTDIFNIE